MQLFTTNIIPTTENNLWVLPEGLPTLKDKALLIVSTPFEAGGPEEQTLIKMLAACSLQLQDTAVIQLPSSDRISWSLLSEDHLPDKILILGISPAQLGIQALFQLNTCNEFMGCTFIPSFDLGSIEREKEIKRALWEQGLKPVFGKVKN